MFIGVSAHVLDDRRGSAEFAIWSADSLIEYKNT